MAECRKLGEPSANRSIDILDRVPALPLQQRLGGPARQALPNGEHEVERRGPGRGELVPGLGALLKKYNDIPMPKQSLTDT
jgi:hypothetical protein